MVQSMDQGAIVGAMYGASDRSGRFLGATDGGLVSSVTLYTYEIKSIVNCFDLYLYFTNRMLVII
jgi:hypothetical protein